MQICGEPCRPLLDVPWSELYDEVTKPLPIPTLLVRSPAILGLKALKWHTFGIVSLSKINAWKICAAEIGMSNQLPNHHGLDLNHPFSTSALNANSKLLVTVYIARVDLSASCGAIPNRKPAKLAPTAGAYLDVRSLAKRGLRSRNVSDLSDRKIARNRVKNRYNSRWKSRTRDKESESRRVRNRCGEPFVEGLHSIHDRLARADGTRERSI